MLVETDMREDSFMTKKAGPSVPSACRNRTVYYEMIAWWPGGWLSVLVRCVSRPKGTNFWCQFSSGAEELIGKYGERGSTAFVLCVVIPSLATEGLECVTWILLVIFFLVLVVDTQAIAAPTKQSSLCIDPFNNTLSCTWVVSMSSMGN